MTRLFYCSLAVSLFFLNASMSAAELPANALPAAAPATQGVSAARLQRLHTTMSELTARGDYLGAVTLIVRHGKIIDSQAYGYRDLARRNPMRPDAIFRIYSMSKTVTAVALLMLMEEGKLGLEDPVGRYLPEFSDIKVFAGGTVEAPVLRAPKQPITIRQLLTHTAGFATFGNRGDAVNRLFDRAELHKSSDLKQYAQRLAVLPLAHDPGEQFHYDGVPIQVVGRLIEVVSGLPFDVYLQQRVFDPLAMRDTGFTVPLTQRGRIAEMTSSDRDGKLIAPAAGSVPAAGELMNPYFSGAGGLYSTAGDYARFAQMLLNGGTLGGVSILGRKTVDLMMQNHLTQLTPPVTNFSPIEGFGLGGSVVLEVARRGRLGSVGQFGWSGAAATYYTIDRSEDLIAILMMQHLPQGFANDPPKLAARFYNLVYQALQ